MVSKLSASRPVSMSSTVPLRSWKAGAERVERQVLVAEDGLDGDGGGRPVADPGVLDLEADLDLGAVERDSGDLADLDAGDAHLVALVEAGGLGEVGAVGGAAAERQPVDVVDEQGDQGEDEQSGDAHGDRVALLDRLEQRLSAWALHPRHLDSVIAMPVGGFEPSEVLTPLTRASQR